MILTFYVNYILDIDLGNNYLAILARILWEVSSESAGTHDRLHRKTYIFSKNRHLYLHNFTDRFFVWSDVWQYERCNRTECPHSEPYQSGGCFKWCLLLHQCLQWHVTIPEMYDYSADHEYSFPWYCILRSKEGTLWQYLKDFWQLQKEISDMFSCILSFFSQLQLLYKKWTYRYR